jgi:SAM-dependent methyltransferase
VVGFLKAIVGKTLRPFAVGRYLRAATAPRLQIASGGNVLEGWLNTDLSVRRYPRVVYLNAKEKLPFPDNIFQAIYIEHFLSCITLDEGLKLLRECHRVLRLAGVLRISTAGWPFVVELLQQQDGGMAVYREWASKTFLDGAPALPAVIANNFVYGFGLKFLYDPQTLEWALRQAGFSNIRRCEVGKSEIETLNNIERHSSAIPEEFNRIESFVMEATK